MLSAYCASGSGFGDFLKQRAFLLGIFTDEESRFGIWPFIH